MTAPARGGGYAGRYSALHAATRAWSETGGPEWVLAGTRVGVESVARCRVAPAVAEARWPRTLPADILAVVPDVLLPLTVRDLTLDELHPGIWGWSDTHLAGTIESLERARRGEADFLAVCPPSGIPVATGGVDFAKPSGIATLWQLSVDAPLRSCGIGTVLIHALEDRIRARGQTVAELGVDEKESRPRALYERLGYVVTGREAGAWDEESVDGTVRRYETMVTVLRKQLLAGT